MPASPWAATSITAALSTQPICVDGQRVNMTAYSIGGNGYVRLRDIGRAVDFGVTCDAAASSVLMDSTQPYREETSTVAPDPTEGSVRVQIPPDAQNGLLASVARLVKIGRIKILETVNAAGAQPTASKLLGSFGTSDEAGTRYPTPRTAFAGAPDL